MTTSPPFVTSVVVRSSNHVQQKRSQHHVKPNNKIKMRLTKDERRALASVIRRQAQAELQAAEEKLMTDAKVVSATEKDVQNASLLSEVFLRLYDIPRTRKELIKDLIEAHANAVPGEERRMKSCDTLISEITLLERECKTLDEVKSKISIWE